MGAKDELIKSVAQAIPPHVMSIFKLPVGFHEDYIKIIRNFWWGEDEKMIRVPHKPEGSWWSGLQRH
jgi:hypothetical protein